MSAVPLTPEELANVRNVYAASLPGTQFGREFVGDLLATIADRDAQLAALKAPTLGAVEAAEQVAQALALEFADGGGDKYPDGWEWDDIADSAIAALLHSYSSTLVTPYREALEAISSQKIGDEIGDEEARDNADYELGYSSVVAIARKALRSPPSQGEDTP